jgi:hypothetical protein
VPEPDLAQAGGRSPEANIADYVEKVEKVESAFRTENAQLGAADVTDTDWGSD